MRDPTLKQEKFIQPPMKLLGKRVREYPCKYYKFCKQYKKFWRPAGKVVICDFCRGTNKKKDEIANIKGPVATH